MSVSSNDIVQIDENVVTLSLDQNMITPETISPVVEYEQITVSGNDYTPQLELMLQEQQKTNFWLTALVFITLFAWAHGHLKNAVRELSKNGKST